MDEATVPQKIVEELRGLLEADERIVLSVLFGSFAQGSAKSDSDIDVAVAFSSPLSLDDRVDLAQKLSARLGREVDIVDLRSAEGVLLQQILNHRKTLVRRDKELLGNLIAKRVIEEEDFMPLYNMMLKKRRERFIHGQESCISED